MITNLKNKIIILRGENNNWIKKQWQKRWSREKQRVEWDITNMAVSTILMMIHESHTPSLKSGWNAAAATKDHQFATADDEFRLRWDRRCYSNLFPIHFLFHRVLGFYFKQILWGEHFGTYIMWTCIGTPLRWLTSGKHLIYILFLY
jgi:hypothetical protein